VHFVLLAYKCAGDGYIHIVNLTSILKHQNRRPALVCSLQWSQIDTQYINLGAASGSYSCWRLVYLIFLYSFLLRQT